MSLHIDLGNLKVAQGQQEIDRSLAMKEAEKQQTYNQLTSERNRQADSLGQQLYLQNAPYLDWLYQQQMNKNMPAPALPIRFG